MSKTPDTFIGKVFLTVRRSKEPISARQVHQKPQFKKATLPHIYNALHVLQKRKQVIAAEQRKGINYYSTAAKHDKSNLSAFSGEELKRALAAFAVEFNRVLDENVKLKKQMEEAQNALQSELR